MKIDFSPAVDLIEKSQRVGLITHIKGDGDAFGSMLALRDILVLLGKEVVIFSNEEINSHVKFLEDFAEYDYKDKFEPVDLLITLDINTKNRLTSVEIFNEAASAGAKILNIDHHEEGSVEDEGAVVVRSTKVSSTAEMIYWLALKLGVEPKGRVADFLLVGIDSDTNFLKNPNTFDSTLKARKALVEAGAREEFLTKKLEEHTTGNNMELVKEVEKRAVFDKKKGVISTYVTEEDHKKFNVEPGVSSVVSTYLDQNTNAKVVIVAEEREGGIVKVSMRSNNSGVDVAKLASFFGGGGHKRAAGFEYEGKISDLLS